MPQKMKVSNQQEYNKFLQERGNIFHYIDEAIENCKEIVKIIEEFKGDSNIPIEDIAPVTDNVEAVSTGFENTNKGSKDLDIHQSIYENSGETQNDTTQVPNASNYLSSAEVKLCFDSDVARKEKNSSTKTTQQRQAILAGFVGTAY
ncbi:MAG: hypothetical protein LBU56_00190 [Rickettsiales bacterium]|jgi:hypothetical protein|nr:hypothetical protein [Rickettsiales bacterium]